MEDVSTYGHVARRPPVRVATTQQLVTITVVVSRAWVSAVLMDIKARGGGGGCGTTWGAGSRRLRGCAPADRADGPGGATRAARAPPWLPAAAGRRRARRRAVGAAGARLRLGLEADQGRRRHGRGGGQRRGREPAVRGPGDPRPGSGRRDQARHRARR